MTTRDRSESLNKSKLKRRHQLPLQNKKLKSMFGIPRKHSDMTSYDINNNQVISNSP